MVRYKTHESPEGLWGVIEAIRREIGIGVVEKERGAPRYAELPVPAELLFAGKAYFESAPEVAVRTQEGAQAACLFNAVASLVYPDPRPKAPTDGPFCVADYNRICQSLSPEEGRAYRLLLSRSEDLHAGRYVIYRT